MLSDDVLERLTWHTCVYHTSRNGSTKDTALTFINSILRDACPISMEFSKYVSKIDSIYPFMQLKEALENSRSSNDNHTPPIPNSNSVQSPRNRILSGGQYSPRTPTLIHTAEECRNMRYQSTQDRLDNLGKPVRPLSPLLKRLKVELKKEELESREDKSDEDELPVSEEEAFDTSWMSSTERFYYDEMDKTNKKRLISAYNQLCKESNSLDSVPLRLQVVQSNLPRTAKLEMFTKLSDPSSCIGPESNKYKTFLNDCLRLPFEKYVSAPCDIDDPDSVANLLKQAREEFDLAIYGHNELKDEFISVMGSLLGAEGPRTHGSAFGICGPVGVGKTSFAKTIAKIYKRPCYMISLGGSGSGATLEGHAYTYEGSRFGEIARALIHCECMNPVIVFDEVCKLADDSRGKEIMEKLVHFTDPVGDFQDRYFAGIPIDVSGVISVFLYNNPERVDPTLRNRLDEFYLTDFGEEEKKKIAEQYILPAICKDLGLDMASFLKVEDGAMHKLVELFRGCTGMRDIKKVLVRTMRIIKVFHRTGGKITSGLKDIYLPKTEPPYVINAELITAVYKMKSTSKPEVRLDMYI